MASKEKFKPKVTGASWLYFLFYFWFRPFLYAFWRRRQFHGRKNIPKDKPIFYIPNHQNAFLDAICLVPILDSTKQFTFLMRAASFKGKLVKKFLYSLNMLPIYRQLDGNENLDKNNEIFYNCKWLLERQRPIICFAEGTHSMIRKMRPFKKGPLRFAFATEEMNDCKLDIHFVPTGINYTDPTNFGGELLVNFGKPIRLMDYMEMYKENQAKALTELKRDLEKSLAELMINLKNDEYYQEEEMSREILIHHFKLSAEGRFATLRKEFEFAQKAMEKLESTVFSVKDIAENLKSRLHTYFSGIKKNKFRDPMFDSNYKTMNVAMACFVFLIGFPIFLTGLTLYIAPYILSVRIATKTVKDPAFNSSIIWATGTLFITLMYLVVFIMCGIFIGNWWIAILTIPACALLGALALWYKRKFNKFMAEIRFKKFRQTEEGKILLNLRKEIVKDLLNASA